MAEQLEGNKESVDDTAGSAVDDALFKDSYKCIYVESDAKCASPVEGAISSDTRKLIETWITRLDKDQDNQVSKVELERALKDEVLTGKERAVLRYVNNHFDEVSQNDGVISVPDVEEYLERKNKRAEQVFQQQVEPSQPAYELTYKGLQWWNSLGSAPLDHPGKRVSSRAREAS